MAIPSASAEREFADSDSHFLIATLGLHAMIGSFDGVDDDRRQD